MEGNAVRIKLGPHKIRVRSLTATERDLGEVRGFFSPTGGVIGIDPDLSPELQACTLVHELLHAAWFASGRDETKDMSEEDIVRTLEVPLTMLLIDNPQLSAALSAASKGTPIVG